MTTPTTLSLIEYQPLRLPKAQLTESLASRLLAAYASQVGIDAPSFMNDHQWSLTNKGWVGHLPVADTLVLHLLPKVPLLNLFGMYAYAYRLNSFRFLDGMIHADTLRDFYEQLALVLSKRVLDRARRGYYRTYVAEADHLPYLRGRLDTNYAMRNPWQARLPCQYQEHTADVEENQLLAWTLRTILRTGLCRDRVQPTVARAYRSLQGAVTLQPFRPEDCVGRLYNRLNQDYHPLHALCRFFLDQTGPTHTGGDRNMIPFVVDMARLFELFVAEWLKQNLPYPWRVRAQERISVGSSNALHWNIDLVIVDSTTNTTRWVLDTKYKDAVKPVSDDITQIYFYAQAKHAPEALLIYPTPVAQPVDAIINSVRVRTITFDLMHNLEAAGRNLLTNLGIEHPAPVGLHP